MTVKIIFGKNAISRKVLVLSDQHYHLFTIIVKFVNIKQLRIVRSHETAQNMHFHEMSFCSLALSTQSLIPCAIFLHFPTFFKTSPYSPNVIEHDCTAQTAWIFSELERAVERASPVVPTPAARVVRSANKNAAYH